MLKVTVQDNEGQTWERIPKQLARKLFADGQYITFCPVRLHPFGAWTPSVTRAGSPDLDFNVYLRNFAWYNCTQETGRYSAYYIKAN